MNTNTTLELSKALCIEAGRKKPQLGKIKDYLAQGADINYQSEQDGFTPLMMAIDRDDEKLVKFLLDQKANPLIKNHHQEIASDIALTHSPIHQLLKNHELLATTFYNDVAGAKAALAAGADVNFQGQYGYTALLIAVENNRLELVELLLVSGADIEIMCNDGRSVYELVQDDLIYKTIDYGKPFTEDEKKSILHREDPERWDRWRLKTLDARNGQQFNLNHLKIYNFNSSATEDQITELEQHFGHPIPETLKEIFTRYNGGEPDLDHFGEEGEGTISRFYTLNDDKDNVSNIWWAINAFSENIGPDTLPFAEDYDGDVYFFKWINGKAEVWIFRYNDHGYDYDEDGYNHDQIPSSCGCMFDSLEELLELLYAAKD